MFIVFCSKNIDDFKGMFYYVNDGAYGTLNCIMYDHAEPKPVPLRDDHEGPLYISTLWGPTCDSMDCITRTAQLPELDIGDWMYFDVCNMYLP